VKKVLIAAVILTVCTLTLSAQNASTTPAATGAEIAIAAPAPVITATGYSSSYDAAISQIAPVPHTQYQKAGKEYPFKPLSRIALGAGIDFLNGVDFIAATNVTRWMNLRATGHYISYTYGSGITESSFTITPSINLRSVQISADLLPFPKHSNFHISPGILFAADNNVTGNVNVPVNQTITLNDVDYKVTGTVTGGFKVNLSPNTTAATIGIGFGNLLPRKGSHWSVPFDIGAAFVGAPTATFNLTGTVLCPTNASSSVCTQGTTLPISSFPQFKSNLTIEENKINSDLNLLQAYPIVSIGVAYNFKIR